MGVGIDDHNVPVAPGLIHGRNPDQQVSIAEVIPAGGVKCVVVWRNNSAVAWSRKVTHVMEGPGKVIGAVK
jgi:hypothetical protein